MGGVLDPLSKLPTVCNSAHSLCRLLIAAWEMSLKREGMLSFKRAFLLCSGSQLKLSSAHLSDLA